jgi:hypothetical protein
MARRRDMSKVRMYAQLRELKSALGMDWARRRGAHAIGIGRKIVEGKKTDTLALRVYVAEKRPLAELEAEELVPSGIPFRSRGDVRESTLPTDVIETPPARFEAIDPETRIRPVPGGVSGGISGSTGTIGGWVWDTTDDTIVLLSNNHVLLNTVGADILQQGTADGGSLPADKIGDVKRTIPRSTTGTNTVDCAIGDVDSSDLTDLTVVDIGPAVHAIDVAVLDLTVEKYGQSTRHTFGEITDADWEGMSDGISFDDCFRVDVIEPSDDWSSSGDSGSLVFSQTPIASGSTIKPAVGLHFAGASTYGVGCKIQNVFNELDLTTLCAGAFAAFIDALFDAEKEGQVGENAEAELRGVSRAVALRRAPLSFAGGERAAPKRLTSGLTRDVEKRLATVRNGRLLTDFVDTHRAELLTLLTRDGDFRRATVAALQPLLVGATTTTDFLERSFTEADLRRLDTLAREVSRAGSPELERAVKPLLALRKEAEGKTIADVAGIRL